MARTDASAAKGDVAKQVENAEDLGFIGVKVDPNPNEAYTLATGPSSPTATGVQVNIADLNQKEG